MRTGRKLTAPGTSRNQAQPSTHVIAGAPSISMHAQAQALKPHMADASLRIRRSRNRQVVCSCIRGCRRSEAARQCSTTATHDKFFTVRDVCPRIRRCGQKEAVCTRIRRCRQRAAVCPRIRRCRKEPVGGVQRTPRTPEHGRSHT